MKHHRSSLLLTILTLTAFAVPALAATVERAPVAPPPTQTSPPTGSPAPPEFKEAPGTAPKSRPSGPKEPQLRVGPTENLTRVASALRFWHKSLTTYITAPANLAVTQPVEISIGYYSPAGSNRITQSYVPSSVNQFLYNDPEGDGKLRKMRIDISLREPKPGGEFYTFSFPWEVTLDPLYDVTISALQFAVQGGCGPGPGDNEIYLYWLRPEPDYIESKSFSASDYETVLIKSFAWRNPEVSRGANLSRPIIWFWEKDVFDKPPRPPSDLQRPNLVPGRTNKFRYVLNEGVITNQESSRSIDPGKCQGVVEYTISYKLWRYP